MYLARTQPISVGVLFKKRPIVPQIKHGPAMLKGWGNSRDSRKTGVGQQLNSTHSILTSGPHH